MKAPDLPEEKPSAADTDNYSVASYSLADEIKARVQAGEMVAATDYPEADRPLFWGAIARVRDDLPAVKPTWRTTDEQHVDGLRTRQKMFKICPRQRGLVDSALAGSVALLAACALLLWWPI